MNPRTQWGIRVGGWLAASSILVGSVGAQTNTFPEFKIERARDYLETLTRLLPNQAGSGADWDLLQARLESQLGRHDQSEQLARRALRQDPARADIQSFLADLLIRQDRMAEAGVCLQHALDLNPNLPGVNRRLGMVKDRLGDHEAARRAFERAIAQAPSDALARLLLGRLLLDQGKAREAQALLERACELEPESANAFYVLFRAQSRLGEHAAAAATLKKFQELKAKEKAATRAENVAYNDQEEMRALAASVHTQAAMLYFRQGQQVLAEAHLRQAIRIAPNEPLSYEMLATILLRSGRLPEARSPCEELVRLRPRQAAYRAQLGAVLLQLNQPAAGVEELKKALDLDPNQAIALNNLARFYLSVRQEAATALDLVTRLAKIQPLAANLDLLGWALYANGKTNEARAAAAQAVARDPNNPVYRERLRRLEAAP
jgi:tetratricopeptide (TPR) repeat protein